MSKAVEKNPIYDVSQGDRIVEVVRLFESVHVVKYRKKFYFGVDKDAVEVIYID